MAVLKWFVPRTVRRVAHPVGYAKRRVTPKQLRAAGYVRHPVGTATSAATLSVLKMRGKRARPVARPNTGTGATASSRSGGAYLFREPIGMHKGRDGARACERCESETEWRDTYGRPACKDCQTTGIPHPSTLTKKGRANHRGLPASTRTVSSATVDMDDVRNVYHEAQIVAARAAVAQDRLEARAAAGDQDAIAEVRRRQEARRAGMTAYLHGKPIYRK